MPLEVFLTVKETVLLCQNCGGEFSFTAGEQSFYETHGLSQPKRCPKCRDDRSGGSSSAHHPGNHPAVCAACGRSITIPFELKEGRPVYCRDCYALIR
jgi:CxxC-x17-CxxC domain-containing protein